MRATVGNARSAHPCWVQSSNEPLLRSGSSGGLQVIDSPIVVFVPVVSNRCGPMLGLTYYGTILIAPEFFSTSDDPTDFNYPALFISSSAELIGCAIGFFLIERVGRKKLSGYAYAMCGACTAILIAGKRMPQALGIVVVMLARGSILLGTSTTWIVTPELFPTHVRAAGHSWCNAFTKLMAFATPFWGTTNVFPLPFGCCSMLA